MCLKIEGGDCGEEGLYRRFTVYLNVTHMKFRVVSGIFTVFKLYRSM